MGTVCGDWQKKASRGGGHDIGLHRMETWPIRLAAQRHSYIPPQPPSLYLLTCRLVYTRPASLARPLPRHLRL